MKPFFLSGVLCLALAAAAVAGSITLAWDAPTVNVDGSPLTDLAGYRLSWCPVVLSYKELAGAVTWTELSRTGPTTTVWIAAPASSCTITNTSRVYAFWMTAVAQGGSESERSTELTARVGAPTTIKLLRKK